MKTLPEKSSAEYEFGNYDSRTLVCHNGPRIVIEVVEVDYSWVNPSSGYGQELFEISEEWRIVEGWR